MILPVALLLVAMLSFQLGAVVAKQLFAAVGTAGATALRSGLASVILLAFWRPWRMRPTVRELRALLVYGVSMGLMNLSFYAALERIPLGIAVALEFTGPLAVAMSASRRPLDFFWIVLAVAGLLALLPLGFDTGALDLKGVAFALMAGFCWAIYILAGRKAGNAHGGQTTAFGTVVGALIVVPVGIAHAGSELLTPAIWPAALGLAVLSSALPYSLEMYALTRIPTRTFGVLMSGDPALAALSGLAFLGEKLSAVQWAAVACIVLASAGSAATSRDAAPAVLPD